MGDYVDVQTQYEGKGVNQTLYWESLLPFFVGFFFWKKSKYVIFMEKDMFLGV